MAKVHEMHCTINPLARSSLVTAQIPPPFSEFGDFRVKHKIGNSALHGQNNRAQQAKQVLYQSGLKQTNGAFLIKVEAA